MAATGLAPALALDADPGIVADPRSTDALLHAIYTAAMNPREHVLLSDLQQQMLRHFREDRAADDTPLTRVMLRHLQRALRMGATHSAMARERRGIAEAIGAVAPPVVVIDGEHHVLGTNAAAEALLARHAQWQLAAGRLHWRRPGALHALLAEADRHASASARCPGVDGEHDLLVHAYQHARGAGTYALLLVDHQRGIRASIGLLAQRCGLTAREVEVVDLAFRGLAPDALCARLQVSPHTLRQHIKHVYAKTGVHNQNALFARVLQDVVLAEATRQNDLRLLPHAAGLSHTRLLQLRDGRQLSYTDHGAPTGMPVLYFHALNGSRLELLLHDERLRTWGIRLIAMDRAGYGQSSFVERDDYRQHVDDVVALVEALQLDRLHIVSASAGTAHAIIAAEALGQRVQSVHCTAVVPPIGIILASRSRSALNGVLNRFFRIVPSLMRPALELALAGQTVESMLVTLTQTRDNLLSLTPADVALIQQPEHLPHFVANMMESLRQGTRAWPAESLLINRPWPIDLRDCRHTIHLWHGTDDGLVPPDMVAAFADALPDGRLHLLAGDSHLLVFRSIDRVMRAILAMPA